MPIHYEDFTGRTFGLYTALSYEKTPGKQSKWLCICKCGEIRMVLAGNLKSGNSTSCGCQYRTSKGTTHGLTNSKSYSSWAAMKSRCYNPRQAAYANYGARGIKVCERWMKFENFFADMGEPPQGTSIDRIDVHGDYEPGNCKWSSYKQQNRNRRTNVFIEFQEQRLCLAEWEEVKGLSSGELRRRIKSGWSIASALSTPSARDKVMP